MVLHKTGSTIHPELGRLRFKSWTGWRCLDATQTTRHAAGSMLVAH